MNRLLALQNDIARSLGEKPAGALSVTPNGRGPGKGKKKRFNDPNKDQPKNDKAQQKWEELIRKPLLDKLQEGVDTGVRLNSRADIEAWLGPLRDELQQKYQHKPWFGFYKKKMHKWGKATHTGQKAIHKPTIQLFRQGRGIDVQDQGKTANSAPVLKLGKDAFIGLPRNLNRAQLATGRLNYNFNGFNNPDIFKLTTNTGITLVNQTLGGPNNNQTASGAFPLTNLGTQVTLRITNTTTLADSSMYTATVNYYYVDPQPRIFSGDHRPTKK